MDGNLQTHPDCIALTAEADVPADVYGARAKGMVELTQAGLPVPTAWAFSVDQVRRFARSDFPDAWPMADMLARGRLVSVRSSAVERGWGGPASLLNIGMCASIRDTFADMLGAASADALYLRFVQDFGVKVARLDAEDFEDIVARFTQDGILDHAAALQQTLSFYEEETDQEFPSDPREQLQLALRSMAVAWGGSSARILREARGAPADAGLGLLVQEMALGVGPGEYGAGSAQFVSNVSGEPMAMGRYKSQGQGRDAFAKPTQALFLETDERGRSLQDADPQAFDQLKALAGQAREMAKDDMRLDFTIEDGQVMILDAVPADRSARAAVTIAVRLVGDGLIRKDDALMAIPPGGLNEVLHPQISPKAEKNLFAKGIGASPGAATGRIVFSAAAAQAAEARAENSILVRIETSPDDIRGMHSAKGILTERGGITSHAAVVARGLGLPCVVGAAGIKINLRKKTLKLENDTVLKEGDVITLDGSTGDVMQGAPDLVEPDLGGDFKTFMSWADETRKLSVRGNADTPHDLRLAQAFGIDGIGLVRTEHMVFDEGRLTVMRQLIFADTDAERHDALNILLPMQRDDYVEMFSAMKGQPICVRLLDPPLHEFLPSSREEMQALAEEMNLPLSQVVAKVDGLSEFNPMLGLRGVRLGLTAPEIYDMQARAIFEAAVAVELLTKQPVAPEIMIPLVSANKEVDLVKSRVDAVAAAVGTETGQNLDYSIGVMVETPRAALKAYDIARSASFFSFGTNDLTQMAYGLSRDDAGRFMSAYVNLGVFAEDPFHSLDIEGVGELIKIAIAQGRAQKPDLKIGLCGEHGGDPETVKFCHILGFDYVSCSAFRTPIARLAAAQAVIEEK